MKNTIINVFKILLAVGLIAWLVQSGKLSIETTLSLLKHPYAVGISMIVAMLNIVLISLRWNFLLSSRSSHHFKLKHITLINWIGQFFSSVLPGSVSGDLIKIFYVQKLDRELSKKFLIFSIFSDRIFGLCGLIIMVGVTSLYYHTELLTLSPALQHILHFNYLLLSGVVVAFLVYFKGSHLVTRFFDLLPKSVIVEKVKELWVDFCSIKKRVLYCVFISLFVQFIGCLIFWLLAKPLLDESVTLFHLLSIVPLGFMTIAIPISPAGLGVGHAVFEKLFSLIGVAHGADFFNLYFLLTLFVNLIGVIPYLFFKKHKMD